MNRNMIYMYYEQLCFCCLHNSNEHFGVTIIIVGIANDHKNLKEGLNTRTQRCGTHRATI